MISCSCGHPCLRVGWEGLRSCLPMDVFREVGGQILFRRGTPGDRAKCLAVAKQSVCGLHLHRVILIFVAGWITGFITAVIYLINIDLQ